MLNTTTLDNGLRVVSLEMPATRSVALGLWLVNGTRHQRPGQSGYAHLLEHLLFKGTSEYDALELSLRFDAMGGQINAHTGRELTAFHGLVPGDQLADLLGLLTGMLVDPAFTDADLDLEREVVFQEMAMVEDAPEEAAEERAVEHAWDGHPMAEPILGREADLRQASAASVRSYLTDLLRGGRLLVSACGAVDHDRLLAACGPLARLPAGTAPETRAPGFTTFDRHETHDGAQSQLAWMMPVPPAQHADHVTRVVANHLLGGGLSSRLFQELRERRGLVYNIQSRLELYSDAGLWQIQTGCEPAQSKACRSTAEDTIELLLREGPTTAEVDHACAHLRADLLIEADDPDATMERLARETLTLGRIPPLEERLAQLDAVTPADVQRVLTEAWQQRACLTWGP